MWRLCSVIKPLRGASLQGSYCRNFSTTYPRNQQSSTYRPISLLADKEIGTFRDNCFEAELPALLPRSTFRALPACDRWFVQQDDDASTRELNYSYLEQFSECTVPLEWTEKTPLNLEVEDGGNRDRGKDETFRRFHAPLRLFLEWTRSHQSQPFLLYLAQCQLSDLPAALSQDVPTPELVLHAGRGDVYDANLWMGVPPTYTPLHRDPNPNLFVQLAGTKHVRMHRPEVGMLLFSRIRMALGQAASYEAAAFRGDEMMQGQERLFLEQAVWDDGKELSVPQRTDAGYEAILEAGDGLFIPKGWWHSIKGIGNGMTASVNWWFR